jgi:hypothetical protein
MTKLVGLASKNLLYMNGKTSLKKIFLLYDSIEIDFKYLREKEDNLYDAFSKYILYVKDELMKAGLYNEFVEIKKLIVQNQISLFFIPETIKVNDENDKLYLDSLMNGSQIDYDKFLENQTLNSATNKFTVSLENPSEALIKINQILEMEELMSEYRTRIGSFYFNLNSTDKVYVPITRLLKLDSITNNKRNQDTVLNIVLNNFPEIDQNSSWERILEFKSDTDSIQKKLALRRWINNISRMNLKPYEVNDELEYLINEYQDSLKLHKLKYSSSKLSAILTFPFKLWKDPVEAVSSLFTLKEKKIELLESERNSPGREFAYITKINSYF